MTATAGTRDRVRQRWQNWRWPIAVGALVVLIALLGALLMPRTNRAPLDPDSVAPEGARALAQILGEQGVDVQRVTRSSELEAVARPGSTLVVVNTGMLGPVQLRRIADTGSTLVLVEPDAVALSELLFEVITPAGVIPATETEPDCDVDAASVAGLARAGGHLYRLPSTYIDQFSFLGCYPGPDGSFSYLGLEHASRPAFVIGQSGILTNEHLAQEGNAALALRTLGTQPRLVWYLPDPLELSDAREVPTLRELVPHGVLWGLAQVLVVLAVVLVWRARRLGRLVTEPLPVVVRAAETHEGRARLYQSAHAHARAAATLRTAAMRRLAHRLDAPAEVTPAVLSELVAGAAGMPEIETARILLGPAPGTDAALVKLADDLDVLEAAVSGAMARPGTDHNDSLRKAHRP